MSLRTRAFIVLIGGFKNTTFLLDNEVGNKTRSD